MYRGRNQGLEGGIESRGQRLRSRAVNRHALSWMLSYIPALSSFSRPISCSLCTALQPEAFPVWHAVRVSQEES